MQSRLLNNDFYTGALDANDAYERAYTEVLADPELVSINEKLIGELNPNGSNAAQIRLLSTGAIRWTLPPCRLQAGTEAFITQLLAYLRGEGERLDANVDVADVLDRIGATTIVEVRTLLAATAEVVVLSIDDYRVAIGGFADQLASGRIPADVPIPGGTSFDPSEALDAILDRLRGRVNGRVRQQITEALLAGGQRDALIAAASVLVSATRPVSVSSFATPHRRSRLRRDRGIGRPQRASAAGHRRPTQRDPRRRPMVRLAVRSVRRCARCPGATMLVLRSRHDARRVCLHLALASVAAGCAVGIAWLAASRLVGPPLEPATSSGPGSWGLPQRIADTAR